ncbi:MAG: M48 family metallopeptidase [Candidatus Aenigmarchaeota archaeon]|nr:M48 family metallopeptidase [Candidatus Aenigmarchaeota archaeon]
MTRREIRYPYKYDPKRRKLAEKYVKGRLHSFIINGIIIPLLALYILVAGGASAGLRDLLLAYGFWLHVVLYAIILFTYMFLVRLPLGFYYSYVREHRYKLSRHTVRSWFSDLTKGTFLGYVFFTAAALVLYHFLQFQLWWLYVSISYAIFIIFINYAFPVIIFPLFYKTKPYADRRMIKRLKQMTARYGVHISTVLVANESAKSTKANAFFAGFGHTKRMVLFDTLIDNFTPAETETVVAHELGHYVNRDIFRGMIIDILKTFAIFYIISLFLNQAQDISLLPSIMLFYMILEIISLPFVNSYSRRVESQADFFALEAAKKPEAQISTERRLVDMALDLERHHPLVEFFLHTHPSAYKRIKMCEEWRRKARK